MDLDIRSCFPVWDIDDQGTMGRALNLERDPGSVCAVASMITSDAKLRTRFDSTEYFRNKVLLKMLQGCSFYIEKGNVHIDVYKRTPTQAQSASTKPGKFSKGGIDLRLVILRSWMASLLLGYLVTLLVIIAMFWEISCTKMHQRLFTYQLQRTSFEDNTSPGDVQGGRS